MTGTVAIESIDHVDLPPIRKERVTEVLAPQRIVEHITEEHPGCVERVEEVQRPLVTKRSVPVPKYEVEERFIKVPKPVIEEKVIEIPDIEWVEKIVEVPQYVYKERRVEVHRPVVHEKIIPIPAPTLKETTYAGKPVERHHVVHENVEAFAPSVRFACPDKERDEARASSSSSSARVARVQRQAEGRKTMFSTPSVQYKEAAAPAPAVPTEERIEFYTPSDPPLIEEQSTFHPAAPINYVHQTEKYPFTYDAMANYPTQSTHTTLHGCRPIVYRHIPRYYEVGIPHYRPIPIERHYQQNVMVPVDLEVEQEIPQPQWIPQYIECPVTVPQDQDAASWGFWDSPYSPWYPPNYMMQSILTDAVLRQNPPATMSQHEHLTTHSPAVSRCWPVGPFPLPPLRFTRKRH